MTDDQTLEIEANSMALKEIKERMKPFDAARRQRSNMVLNEIIAEAMANGASVEELGELVKNAATQNLGLINDSLALFKARNEVSTPEETVVDTPNVVNTPNQEPAPIDRKAASAAVRADPTPENLRILQEGINQYWDQEAATEAETQRVETSNRKIRIEEFEQSDGNKNWRVELEAAKKENDPVKMRAILDARWQSLEETYN